MTLPDNVIHVAVAVIIKNNKILIARRPSHVHQGARWEFPGGKVEPGETLKAALYREIREELGIEIIDSEALISVLYHYDDKSVLLDTWKISNFTGRAYEEGGNVRGLEGQQVQWADIDKLDEYEFPAANKPIVRAISLPDTYLITPDTSNPAKFLNELKQALKSLTQKSSLLLQLRLHSLDGTQLDHLLIRACELAKSYPVKVILNAGMFQQRDETASSQAEIITLADGLHLPSGLLSDPSKIEQYRQQFPQKLLGASCHNQVQIERANRLGVDFLVLSPVQATQSHAGAVPLGWENFTALTKFSQAPVYALGGLGLEDMNRAKSLGGQGIAGISALWNPQ